MNLRLSIIVLVLISLTSFRADAAPAAPAAGPTLAQALATMPPSKNIALAVNADLATRPLSAGPVGPETTLGEIASAYGLWAHKFGSVTAVAPATMTLVNDRPSDPNIYLDMEPYELLTLLSASLTDAQWRAMTGPDGARLSDLTKGDQPQIVAALFPDPKFQVYPDGQSRPQEYIAAIEAAVKSGKPFYPTGLLDMTSELPNAHLRLGVQTSYWFKTPGQGYSGSADATSSPAYVVFPAKAAYGLGAADPHPKDIEYGIAIAATEPNSLKAGDLDYSDARLNVPIPLDGIKTVGDLVARTGKATQIELYADPRLSSGALTIVGASHTAPAADLLRALALCLTGTFRQVGPAFVLTENRTGSGTIHQSWGDIADQVGQKKQSLMMNISDAIAARHSPTDLHGFGSDTDLTDAQRDQALQPADAEDGMMREPGELYLPLDKLTPGQQTAVRRMAAQTSALKKDFTGDSSAIDLTGKIRLEMQPTWELTLPSLHGPVKVADCPSIENLFDLQPTPPVSHPKPTKPGPPAPKPPALAAVLKRIPNRAVIAAPATKAQVDSLVESMRTTGMNQLWLSVFTQGQDRSELLTDALHAAHGNGISVYAVLDLLTWGAKAPSAARDRNIFGEDSAQADAHMQRTEPDYQIFENGLVTPLPRPDQIIVSPDAPAVHDALLSLAISLAKVHGLAGMVWRDDEPPGYDALAAINADDGDRQLGYNDALRVAFLRETHIDPLDVAPNNGVEAVDPFLWPVPGTPNVSAGMALTASWKKFRSESNLAFLRELYASVRSAAPSLPILIRQRHFNDGEFGWYGTWYDPRKIPPTYRSNQDIPQPGELTGNPPAENVQAKAQSRIALTILAWPPDWPGSELAQDAQDEVIGKGWDGFVLDFTHDYTWPAQGGNPLSKLAKSMNRAR